MTTELAAARSTRAQRAFTEADLRRLRTDRLVGIKDVAAPEDWGEDDMVLVKYLALHVPLAIEQGRYVWNGKEIVMRAGHLATAEGAAVYLGLAPADWSLAWAAERPNNVEALLPADLGSWPELDPRREVVIACDFQRSKFGKLPPVLRVAAVSGAVEWSIRRGLAVRQFHGESRGYFAPVHLTDRAVAPELVAPVQVQSDRLVVRTLLDLHVAYAPARAVVERVDQLPAWLTEWRLATGGNENMESAEQPSPKADGPEGIPESDRHDDEGG